MNSTNDLTGSAEWLSRLTDDLTDAAYKCFVAGVDADTIRTHTDAALRDVADTLTDPQLRANIVDAAILGAAARFNRSQNAN